MRLTIDKQMKKGFTLVEVVVVIGIIAVLTVIIFPAINDIRAKNRDAEKVADIAALQLGLSLYYSQATSTKGYPETLEELSPKYVPTDSLSAPSGDPYSYVPLKREGSNRCSYYHLGTELELPSGQVDTADTFNSTGGEGSNPIVSGGYYWCGDYGANPGEIGITPGGTNYNVHP